MISTAEDCQIKVWDLVMRGEIAHLKGGHNSLITSLSFSSDKSTLITSSRDGKVGFWNARDGYKPLSMFKYSKAEEEINAVYYTEY